MSFQEQLEQAASPMHHSSSGKHAHSSTYPHHAHMHGTMLHTPVVLSLVHYCQQASVNGSSVCQNNLRPDSCRMDRTPVSCEDFAMSLPMGPFASAFSHPLTPSKCPHMSDLLAAGGAQARMLERLLLGSSGSLSSSGQSAGQGLAAVGRAVSTGAEGSSGPAPAPAAASAPVKFPFDFFEKTRCISGSARLSGDFSQTGRLGMQPLQLPTVTEYRMSLNERLTQT